MVRRRRMVRRYDASRPVSAGLVRDLLELAVRAPSAGFTQGWHFLVLSDAASRERFWAVSTGAGGAVAESAAPDPWLTDMRTAPVLVLALSDASAYLDRYAEADKGWTDRDPARWPVPYWHVDTGMASLLILLGAVDRGLAGCFFGVPGESTDAVRAEFAIPPALAPVGVLSLGYPRPDRRSPSLRRGRRAIDDVVSWQHYGRPETD